jgi:hypothetical protein
VEKLLAPVLRVRALASNIKDQTGCDMGLIRATTSLGNSIEQMLRHGLFHQDHLADFGTVLQSLHGEKGGNGRHIASYQKQLFDQLKQLVSDSTSASSALDAFSTLYALFVEASRRRQRALESSNATALSRGSSSEQQELTVRQLEFAFFEELYHICYTCNTVSTSHRLSVSNALLQVVAEMNVYRTSNDAVSTQQRVVFTRIAQQCVEALQSKGELYCR